MTIRCGTMKNGKIKKRPNQTKSNGTEWNAKRFFSEESRSNREWRRNWYFIYIIYNKYIYGLVGIVVGVVIVDLLQMEQQKNQSKKICDLLERARAKQFTIVISLDWWQLLVRWFVWVFFWQPNLIHIHVLCMFELKMFCDWHICELDYVCTKIAHSMLFFLLHSSK